MISETIQKQINEAMKKGESVRVMTLKLLSAELHRALIEKKRQALTEEEELSVVKKEAKKRKEAIAIYEEKGITQRAQKEKEELAILEEFLPEEMGEEELLLLVESAIAETGARGPGDVGRVIGLVMQGAKGRANGSLVSQMVRERLSK